MLVDFGYFVVLTALAWQVVTDKPHLQPSEASFIRRSTFRFPRIMKLFRRER